VVDAILLADLFGVVQRRRTVAVGDNEDVLGRKDFECCGERGTDELGSFVLHSTFVSM
jgi:hypothetical protein